MNYFNRLGNQCEILLSKKLVALYSSGFLGGGQIGYNWVRKNLLLGLESDINYTSLGGTNSITFTPTLFSINHSVIQNLNWFGTARMKVGKIVSDNLLPYVTAGLSFANVGLAYSGTALFLGSPVVQNASTHTQNNLSLVAGAGLEYAVSEHFNYKLEYLYLDLGKLKLNTTYYTLSSNFASNIIRLGINFHF
jgi:outer membrane immunogenic protein